MNIFTLYKLFHAEQLKHLVRNLNVSTTEVLIALFVLLLTYQIIESLKKSWRNYPPGPFGLPIVGYIPFLSEKIHLDLTKLGQKYGDVFSVPLGSKMVVILHGAETIREAYAKPEFLSKPPGTALEMLSPKSPFFAEDIPRWKEQRRFVVQSMRDLGMGKTKIEDDIQDEIRYLLDVLERYQGQPLNLRELMLPSISNNVCALVFGKRYDYQEEDRKFLDQAIHEISTTITQTSSVIYFPWFKYIPFCMSFLKVKTALNAISRLKTFFQNEINKRRESACFKEMRDYIDSYILEMKTRKEKFPNTTFTDESFVNTVIDLFGAGSETVLTSIMWCVYLLAAYPAVQKKVQAEIDDVVGSERSPVYMDHKSLPYTMAVILEVLRWKPVVPLNLMRYTTSDTTAGGYTIPKGTMVIANFWNVHHDARYWKDPDSFQPERFLSSDGQSLVKSNNFMAFSLGSRVCPGETMAMMELFLYFSSMLQKFDIVFPEGYKPTFETELGVTYNIKTYPVRFKARN